MHLIKRTKVIRQHLIQIENHKFDLAFMLYDTKLTTNWRSTQYGSWINYCNQEIPLAQSTIYKYLNTAKLAKEFNYCHSEVGTIVHAIGWARFQLGLTKLTRRILPKTFIKRFNDLNLNERVTYSESDSDLVNFSFQLPEDVATSLTGMLLARGMRINNKSRVNASHAMCKLVDEMDD